MTRADLLSRLPIGVGLVFGIHFRFTIDVRLEVGIGLSGGEERKKNTQEPSLSLVATNFQTDFCPSVVRVVLAGKIGVVDQHWKPKLTSDLMKVGSRNWASRPRFGQCLAAPGIVTDILAYCGRP